MIMMIIIRVLHNDDDDDDDGGRNRCGRTPVASSDGGGGRVCAPTREQYVLLATCPSFGLRPLPVAVLGCSLRRDWLTKLFHWLAGRPFSKTKRNEPGAARARDGRKVFQKAGARPFGPPMSSQLCSLGSHSGREFRQASLVLPPPPLHGRLAVLIGRANPDSRAAAASISGNERTP